MSKNAILVHGWVDKKEFYDPHRPTASNAHWFPWLTKQLMIKDIYTVAPEMPKGYYPEYAVWKKEFERFDITADTMVVGHSCGAGFLVRWLSENPGKKVDKAVLVAPWLGLRFNDEPFDEEFFKFKPVRTIASQTKGLHVFCSSDDFQDVRDSAKILLDQVDDARYCEFDGKGHFTFESLGGEEFPELLEELIR